MRKFARMLSAALLSGCLLAGTAAPGFSALAAEKELPVWPKNESLKVLAIGNSFSEDAMRWMYDIAEDCGAEDVVFANLYIGGCSLERHVSNIQNDSKAYDYQRISKETGGVWKHSGETEDPWSISQGLQEEDWDYITIQQVSGYSGDPASFKNGDTDYIDELVNYIRKYNTTAKIGYHMTWAYQQDSSHGDFGKYDKDQMTMYNAILSTVQNTVLAEHPEIDFVIPSGTTIQNLRTSFLGDTLTRDGYHMSYNLGRYAVGLTWILKVAGWSIDDVTFTPSAAEVPASYLPMIKEAVKNAVANPWEVTRSSYLSGPFYNDYDMMVELDIKAGATKFAYWQSDHSGRFNRPVTEDGNSNQFVATRQFTKLEIPVGSVIELDEGYQYRPDAWVDPGERNPSRPGTVSSSRVVVDEGWWGDFTVRGFNVFKTGNPALSEEDAEDILNHIHIYVPKLSVVEYKELDLKTGSTQFGYWQSDSAENFGRVVTGAGNSNQFVATRQLTKEEIPVGSIIELDEGYQYRPDAWVDPGQRNPNRPGNVTSARVIIGESWWGDFTVRGFNVAKEGNPALSEEEAADVLNHIHIYVPVLDMSGYELLDLKTTGVDADGNPSGVTEAAYWNTSDVNGHSNLWKTNNNSKQFVATALLTEEDMPVGSIIEVDAGWQYRPERWINFGEQQQNRPDNSTASRTVVDESWWDPYTLRAFNISTTDAADLTGRLDEALTHFRIYIPVGESSQNLIESIAFTTLPVESCTFGENTIEVNLSESWNITNLAPDITVSDKATISPDPSIPQDFSQPVTYTVTAENGEERTYTVTITMPISSEAEIKSFTLAGCNGVIDGEFITVTVPRGTDLTALAPEIEISHNATVTPASGEVQNFTRRVQYTVTAEDGATTASYIVQVTEADMPAALEEARDKAEDLLSSMEVTNETTADGILDAVAEAIGNDAIALSWAEDFQLTPATEEAEGSITGAIQLELDGQTLDVALDLIIDQLPNPLKEARDKAEDLLGSMEVTNETTADGLLDAVAEAIGNDAIALSWAEDFQLIPATEEAEGSITGTIRLALEGQTLDVALDLTIDRLPPAEVTKGDLDGNGVVDITDVMAVCRILARQNAGSDPSVGELAAGDLTGDGEITIEDVMAICRILASNAQQQA